LGTEGGVSSGDSEDPERKEKEKRGGSSTLRVSNHEREMAQSALGKLSRGNGSRRASSHLVRNGPTDCLELADLLGGGDSTLLLSADNDPVSREW